MQAIVKLDCIKIIDSYTLNKREWMQIFLTNLKSEYSNSNVWNRSMNSLIREWKAHNRLYYLGLWKSHTKDVDLESNPKWYLNIIYFILGI